MGDLIFVGMVLAFFLASYWLISGLRTTKEVIP